VLFPEFETKYLAYIRVEIFEKFGAQIIAPDCTQTLSPDIILPFTSTETQTQHDGVSLLHF